MKSLLRRVPSQSTSRNNRPNHYFRPRCQPLESRLLLAGPDLGVEPQHALEPDLVQPFQESATRTVEKNVDGRRQLNDLQATIEVRFMTLQDKVFQRIGVNFDSDIDDGSGLSDGSLSECDKGATFSDGPGPSPDLGDIDLIFGDSAIGPAVPVFGDFNRAAGNIGFAMLSDIEAFFLMQALRADDRADVYRSDVDEASVEVDHMPTVDETESRPLVTSVVRVVR